MGFFLSFIFFLKQVSSSCGCGKRSLKTCFGCAKIRKETKRALLGLWGWDKSFFKLRIFSLACSSFNPFTRFLAEV